MTTHNIIYQVNKSKTELPYTDIWIRAFVISVYKLGRDLLVSPAAWAHMRTRIRRCDLYHFYLEERYQIIAGLTWVGP